MQMDEEKQPEADIEIPQEHLDQAKEKKEELQPGWKHEVFDLAKTFIICLIAVFLLTKFVIRPVQVDGKSMYPTLEDRDIGLMNVFSAKFLEIKRYDVVVVYNEEKSENWVKRIIGMPGDTISASEDKVYINGEAIEEPYLDMDYVNSIRNDGGYFTQDFDERQLGEDEYFLMGDNRPVSYDSRYVGPFTKDEIRGKDVYVVYPFNHLKIVGNGASDSK